MHVGFLHLFFLISCNNIKSVTHWWSCGTFMPFQALKPHNKSTIQYNLFPVYAIYLCSLFVLAEHLSSRKPRRSSVAFWSSASLFSLDKIMNAFSETVIIRNRIKAELSYRSPVFSISTALPLSEENANSKPD